MREKTKKTEQVNDKKVEKLIKKTSPFEVPVYNLSGKEEKRVLLSKDIFSVTAHPKLIAQAIRVYLANRRQNTVSTKTRAEVSGSTKKIYRQKGTGRARHGDIKAPIFVGGGVVGGPKPKDQRLSLTKKQKRKALFAALTLKLKENNLFVLSSDVLKITPKTKIMIKFLETLKFYSQKILFVFLKIERNNFILASRNIPKVSFVEVKSLNAYQILNHDKIVFFEESLSVLQKNFLRDEN